MKQIMIKGGSYNSITNCRITMSSYDKLKYYEKYLGFRLIKTLKQ